MNINHLAIFHAVAEEGSVSRGAARLHISQPAVSKQLRELERSLGLALFHRLSKGVRLTEAGELLAGYARSLFALEQEAEQALGELRSLERGRLVIGASTTVGNYVLPALCATFRQQHPGIELTVEIANASAIRQGLAANRFDLALSEGFMAPGDVLSEVFAHDNIVAIVAPNHHLLRQPPPTITELCAEAFIVREAGSGTREVVDEALRLRGIVLQPHLVLGGSEAIRTAVANGAGVALISELAIARDLAEGRLAILKVADFSLRRGLQRLRLAGTYEGRAAREFMRHLRSWAKE